MKIPNREDVMYFIATLSVVIVIVLTIFAGVKDFEKVNKLPEDQFCARYYNSVVQSMPARCLKYYK